MKTTDITSIGWLNHTQGIQLVACTADNSYGHRKIISVEDFEATRNSAESLKKFFLNPRLPDPPIHTVNTATSSKPPRFQTP